MKKHLFLFILLCYYVQAQTKGQLEAGPKYLEQKLRFSHLTIDEGLSQGFVSSIVQDDDGYMWFGTSDGLNRYDGYGFKTFRFNSFDNTSIPDNSVSELIKDKKGRIWAGTTLGGLSCYNKKTESFFRFSFTRGKPNSIVGDYIYCIIEDHTGELPAFWIITNSFVLNQLVLLPEKKYLDDSLFTPLPKSEKWIAEGYRVIHYSLIPQDSLKSLSLEEIKNAKYDLPTGNSIVLDRSHYLWISLTNREIIRVKLSLDFNQRERLPIYNPVKNSFQYFKLEFPFVPDNKDDDVFLFSSKNGEIWGAMDPGIIKLADKNSRLLKFNNSSHLLKPAFRDEKQTGHFERVDGIAEDQQGKFWMATRRGIFSFSPGSKKFTYYPHDPSDPESPLADNFPSVFVDRGNVVWFGSFGYGLSYVNPGREAFHHFNNPGLPNFSLYDIVESGKNKFLLQMPKRRNWLYFDRSTNNIIKPPLDLVNYEVFSIVEDNDNNIWFVSGKKLYVKENNFNGATKLVYPLSVNGTLQAVYKDNYGNIWAAGAGEVACIDSRTYQLKRQFSTIDLLNRDELIKCVIKGFYRDPENRVWLISTTGLTRIDLLTGKIQRYKSDENNKSGLNSNDILTIHPDPYQPGKILWLGTRGGGLNRFDITSGKVTYYTVKDGLPNDVIYGLLADGKNNLWMSTNFGISCMELIGDTLANGEVRSRVIRFTNYDKSDGLQGNEFNRDSFLKTKSGELMFGGLHGFNLFNPDEILKNTHIPQVAIIGLSVNYKQVEYKAADSILTKPISETTSLTFPYYQNTLTFEFASLDYSSVSKNRFSYKLEGYDKDWSKPQTSKSATYTQIPPGRYKLFVKGSNNSGIWNLKGTSLEIIIIPPLWLRWWFLALAALLFFSSVIIFIRWISTRKLKRKYEMLQRENEIRTKISRDLHDEIGSRVTQISLFSNFITDGEHETKKFNWGINNIKEAASDIASAMDEVVWTINPRNDNVSSFAGYLVQYTVSYLDKAEIKPVVDVPDIFPPVHLISEKRHAILMVVKEAISNIVKHSKADTVILQVRYESYNLCIEIQDNGRGFSDEDIRLFGNGLKVMRSRIEEINGVFQIKSIPGKGTSIKMNVRIED